MTAEIPIAITFTLDPELVARIEAVDPRIRVLDFPQLALRPGVELAEEERSRAKAVIAEAEVLFGPPRIPPEIIAAAENLKWFQSIVAGADALVKEGLVGRHFVVTNASGLAAAAIAEWCVGAMIVLNKGMHFAIRNQPEHKWEFRFAPELRGQTCGIAGMGAIGRELALRARAMGMRVVASRRSVALGGTDPDCDVLLPSSDLDALLRESDFLVLCVPLTPETEHLIGAAELAKMKPTASLLNVARGGVVDQDALIAALRDGTIAGAAVDVTDPEPLPPESPLWDLPNIMITPHTSGAVEGYGHRATEIFLRNLAHYCKGEPLENVIDPVLLY
jgi:phosphoglycerate dehydrogenase-like enzyme